MRRIRTVSTGLDVLCVLRTADDDSIVYGCDFYDRIDWQFHLDRPANGSVSTSVDGGWLVIIVGDGRILLANPRYARSALASIGLREVT